MELTKKQTIKLIINQNKQLSFNKRYKFTTKYKWKCLGCMSTIYVSYAACSRQSIYCKQCYNKVQTTPNIIQYQYIRKLKEQQMKFIDTYIDGFIDNNNI